MCRAGSTPKDGPSAGITLFTAIASLVTGKAVDTKTAMTGEITLRGSVLPVGGIKEKVIAAHRSGIERILLPKENLPDLEDVPEEIRKDVTFVPVERVEDVLREALDIKLKKGIMTGSLVIPTPAAGKQPQFCLNCGCFRSDIHTFYIRTPR